MKVNDLKSLYLQPWIFTFI